MKRVTCFGTGLIGTGWGVVFLRGGCKVVLYDIDQEKIDAARKTLNGMMDFFFNKGLMTEEQRKQCLDNASFTTNAAEAVKDAEFIQESSPENLDLKKKVLRLIEENCPVTAIIASSTSGLLLSDITDGALHPERIVGGHPYNPPYVMPLVEISRIEKTDQKYVDAAKAFYKELGKEPVILNKESKGFLCNRIQAAVCREAMDLVNRGVCSVEDIDKAVVFGVGLRWAIIGPHLVNHLGGGANGFGYFWDHLSGAFSSWLKDMANWTDIPPVGYVDKAMPGITEAMAHREPGTGKEIEELRTYLTNGIIEILKYHKMI